MRGKDTAMTILAHIQDLRRALFIILLSLIPGTMAGWLLRQVLVSLLIRPVQAMHFPLVYITPTEAFLAQFKLALAAGVVFASPVILWQLWTFILPALKRREKVFMAWFLPLTVLFFAGGIIFAFYTVFPVGVRFLLSFGGDSLHPMLSIGRYLSFSAAVLLPFGFIFEMPPAVFVLSRLGLVSGPALARRRKYAILAIVVIAAALTPGTDVVSQVLMAVPMYILYEISVGVAYLARRQEPQPALADGADMDIPLATPPGNGPEPLSLEETLEQIKKRGSPGHKEED